jgi:hypothetical protein
MLIVRGPIKFNKLWLYNAAIQTPSGRLLLFTIVISLLSLVYRKRRFWRDPHSAFFDSSTVYNQGYSIVRAQEALDFLDSPFSYTRTTPSDPVICAGIVTVRCKHVQYLNTTIGTMLAGLGQEERSAIHVRLLFANTDPQDHPDYGRQWLE